MDKDTTDITDITEKVQIILRQTEYTEEQAIQKLKEKNNNPILVIKEYMGIQEKPKPPIQSINQEIYKQIRGKLDGAMREYTERKEKEEKTSSPIL